MSVETAGISRQAGLFSGPEELVQRGMTALAVVVVFVTVGAPLGKLIGTLYVLLRPAPRAAAASSAPGVRAGRAARALVDDRGLRLRRVRRLRQAGRPGDHRARHRRLRAARPDIRHGRGQTAHSTGRRSGTGSTAPPPRIAPAAVVRRPAAGSIGCEACGLVSVPTHGHARCPRCGSRAARAQAGQHRADLGIGDRRGNPLHPGEPVSRC